jgi:hypothetical protein
VDINLPRPRKPSVKRSSEALAYVDYILDLVMREGGKERVDDDDTAAVTS